MNLVDRFILLAKRHDERFPESSLGDICPPEIQFTPEIIALLEESLQRGTPLTWEGDILRVWPDMEWEGVYP